MVIVLESQVIYYTHEGNPDGRPIILLHGNGENHHIFDELSASLQGDFDIYAIDSRGHGMSACPKELHYKDMAGDLFRFIVELGIKKPLIVGFSDGAITALLLGTTHSDLINGIISCGANTNPGAIDFATKRAIKKAYKEKTAGSSSIEKNLDTISSELFAQTGELERLMLTEPDISTIALSHIHVPVLVMAGSRDCVKSSDTKKIASAIPQSRLVILPGESHESYVVHSVRLEEYVRGFRG